MQRHREKTVEAKDTYHILDTKGGWFGWGFVQGPLDFVAWLFNEICPAVEKKMLNDLTSEAKP